MFKKILQSLTKSQAKPAPAPAQPARPPAEAPKAAAPALTPRAGAKPAAAAPQQKPAVAKHSPEQLCGITGKMSPEQIRARLKLLYRRYNRSASSLDAKLRNEADAMLNAIVEVREKHFGQI